MTAKSKKEELLAQLYKPYTSHTTCPLGRTDKHNLVFGTGNINAQFMIVGEAPGQQEEEQGLPFVGRSGQLLTKILHALNVNRKDIFITNVVKCRPQNNRTPTHKEIEFYKPLLLQQIRIINPHVICTLGSVAGQTLLSTTKSITSLRGITHHINSTTIIPTYHPAYILRNMSLAVTFAKDIQKAINIIGFEEKNG